MRPIQYLVCLLSSVLLLPLLATTAHAGESIAWYGTLDSARKEAKRTKRPILLIAARPECRGVPGFW